MKVHIPNFDTSKIGGGWTQTRYLAEGLGNSSYEEADIYFISGATMVSHSEVEKAFDDNRKIVLRVDNHLLPSRNRNTGISRMKAFAKMADLIVYQSEWARNYLLPMLGDGKVILNGVDTSIFKPGTNHDNSLYVRSSRINEKGWEMARYWFSRNNEGKTLNIVGKFSGENIEYNFDLYNGEKFKFWGEQPRENLAEIMRSSKYFLYSYFMDACSNTLLEARASGCEIIDIYGMLQTGGAPEIMALEDLSKERMIKEYEECLQAIG